MFQVKTVPSISLRFRGGFPMMRRVMIIWPGLTRQYHNGPNNMLWAEWTEA